MDFLKLVAFDQDDLKILAAHVQDALIKVGDLEYLARQKRFAIPMNRFAWEKVERKIFRRPRYRRHQSVLDFGRILSVRSRGIDRTKPSEVLSLLTLHFVKKEPPSGTIELVFSGDAALLLDVECIEARLADTGAAWETASLPRHDD
ncbi:DUF2948 family protein [Chelativorans composti]|jgi:Protein of unknown function (DUF2948).|uniref:DUF2948 family protein n=1 Tax=Chelativorans composti TaxID=768533 RepID=A0ABW5DHU3_9HYPH